MNMSKKDMGLIGLGIALLLATGDAVYEHIKGIKLKEMLSKVHSININLSEKLRMQKNKNK